jgi:hypothetical protein
MPVGYRRWMAPTAPDPRKRRRLPADLAGYSSSMTPASTGTHPSATIPSGPND